MAKTNKGKIQFLLNEYLDQHGKIDLLLPDGVGVEIGITQEGPRGPERRADYCWIATSRDDRSTILDQYSLSVHFDDPKRTILAEQDEGDVTII
jgi:hypothetical protein